MFGQPLVEVNSDDVQFRRASADHQPVQAESPHPEQARRAWRDGVALGAVALAAATVSGVVNVHERLHRWADRHEPYDPFQLLPVAVGLAVLTLAYLIVTRRRLRREVAIRQEREASLTRALQQIEVLSGLLAMCAACKRVRDEDDRWVPVEAYLKRNEISVSHGICPGCVDRLYPDYVDGLAQPAG
jgi:heme exporter protein D